MAKEIERKFLVRKEILIPLLQDPTIQRKQISQFYLVSSKDAAVRIRKTAGRGHAVLTVKSGGDGLSTDEFEFDVALSEYADKLEDRVGHEIAKTRHLIEHNGRVWEVDTFHGTLDGLVVAELECDDAAEVTDYPDWVAGEVTYDSRYKNAVLALRGAPETVVDVPQPEIAALGDVVSHADDTAGATEAPMFAPGGAVLTRRPSIDPGIEGVDSIPEDGIPIHVASRGHAAAAPPHTSGDSNAHAGIAEELSAMFAETADEPMRTAWQSFVASIRREG